MRMRTAFMSSGMLLRVASQKYTDVSEVLTASVDEIARRNMAEDFFIHVAVRI
jgi:hypothetical protein